MENKTVSFDFNGKNVLVTGASRGIGKAIARAFAESGATVYITARRDSINGVAKELNSAGFCGKVIPLTADLSSPSERARLVTECLARCDGQLDILVNNAGMQIRHPAEEFPLDDFERVLNVNLNAVFDLSVRIGRTMVERKYGKIVNLASMLSYFGGITVPAYAASKGGVAQLTKALSNDWAKYGVNVNAVAPGYMDTEMNEAIIHDPKRYQEIVSRIPAGYFGAPEAIAGTVLFLCSDAAAYISGAVIPVDGGYLAR